MSRIIAIANQKGGVGKTTTAFNLGVALEKKGKKVLAVDLDPQDGNLTACMGMTSTESRTITDWLFSIINHQQNDYSVFKPLHHREKLDLIPCDEDFALLNLEMKENDTLKQFLNELEKHIQYDFILLDCPPTLGITTVNAFVAANSVLIPTLASYLPARGTQSLLGIINQVKSNFNPWLDIEGILITNVDTRCSFPMQMIEIFREQYGSHIKIFSEFVPRTVKIEESSAMGVSNFKHNPTGRATESYIKLAEEVILHGN